MERSTRTFGAPNSLGLAADTAAVTLLVLADSSLGVLALGVGAAAAGGYGLFTGGDPKAPGNRLRSATALVLVVIGCGLAGAATHRGYARPPAGPVTATAPSPSPTARPADPSATARTPEQSRPCGTATIENPQPNDRVGRGTPVVGRATTCPGRDLWTMAVVDGQYYVRPRDSLVVTDGEWRDPFAAIISGGHLNPPKLTLIVVETDANGTEVIKEKINGDVDYRGVQLTEFAESHMFILDSVTVHNAEHAQRTEGTRSNRGTNRRPAPDGDRDQEPAGDPSREPVADPSRGPVVDDSPAPPEWPPPDR
jgi:hypothetical protein